MVKIDHLNNQSQTNSSADQPSSTNQKNQSGLLTIIGNLLPFAPMAFEQLTGQKVPPMTGTMAEVQTALVSIQTNLQTIANNQNQLANRLQQLENSAVQQLTSLTHQFNSLRLTHTKERKEIEYNPPHLENDY